MKRTVMAGTFCHIGRFACPTCAADKVADFFVHMYQSRFPALNARFWLRNPTLFAYPFIDGLSAIASEQG